MLEMPEQLRLGLGLAHAWPGGTIELRTDGGQVLRASHRSCDADGGLTPCELRAALLSRACPLWPSVAARLVDVTVTGDDVVDLGGGLYARRCRHGSEQRWFATFLAPTTVRELLDECPLEMPDVLDASLRPDPDLGVVVVTLSTQLVGIGTTLDEAGRWASAACFTRELMHAARQPQEAS
jgi:hypothetical protein